MFTPGEMTSIQQSLYAVEFEIARRESEIKDEQTFVGKALFPSERRRALNVLKSIRDVAIRQRNFYIEDQEPRHEEALQLVEMLGKASTVGWVDEAIKQPSLVDKLSDLGRKLVKPILDNPLSNMLGKYTKWILIVAAILGLAYLAGVIVPLLPRRRST